VLSGFGFQKRFPDQLIVADDGSGMKTAEVVKKFSDEVNFPVFHVWQKDKGFRVARIRNKAITKASEEYIIILDGDCIVDKHFIADHLSLAENGCFIQGKRVIVNKDASAAFNHGLSNSNMSLLKLSLTGKLSNIHHLLRLPVFPSLKNRNLKGIKSCNMSFFKHDILAVNGFNENFVKWGNEDSELACRLFRYGLKKKIHPFMAVCFHLWHPTNKTAFDMNKELLAETIASEEYFCDNGIIKKY
jgi:glycosyltransferase involved in cell wall biosynthesis